MCSGYKLHDELPAFKITSKSKQNPKGVIKWSVYFTLFMFKGESLS